jgi:D-alanyl-D-alanine dipeptidase
MKPQDVSHPPLPSRHHLITHHAPSDFVPGNLAQSGEYSDQVLPEVRISVPGMGITTAGVATYESPVIADGFDYNEALLSWNIDLSPRAGFCVEARMRSGATGNWTPYLRFGEGGRGVPAAHPVTQCAEGQIDIDYFKSDRRFDRLQYRILAIGGDPERADVVHIERFTVCLTETTVAGSGRPLPAPQEFTGTARPAIRLPVPFLSQRNLPERLANRVCGPTSVAMVLSYRGVELPVETLAKRVYDPVHHIYGNWPRAIQEAYLLGVPGYLTRFSDWNQVREVVENGQPLVITITAEVGDLSGAPFSQTNGHLLVLTGFDDDGRVLVNDPAAPDEKSGRLAYRLDELDLVWMRRKHGAAYVLLPSGGEVTETEPGESDPLVDLTTVDPRIRLDIRYATTNNMTRTAIYASARCMLRKSVAERLRRVQDALARQSLGLKVFDAYRPLAAQRRLWAAMPDPRYVANPARAGRHVRGTAVDVTLVDSEGRELEMPTDYDAFSPASHRNYQGGSTDSRNNRDLLQQAMASEGFVGLASEWWHFDVANWRSFPPLPEPPG